jgi:hypothetical protein
MLKMAMETIGESVLSFWEQGEIGREARHIFLLGAAQNRTGPFLLASRSASTRGERPHAHPMIRSSKDTRETSIAE